MSEEELDGIVRRRLVVLAVDTYQDEQAGFREGIAAQVERITGWLADPELGDDRRFEVVQAGTPLQSVRDVRAFLHELNLAAADYKEALVVYITGHGLHRNSHRHYLQLKKTQKERLLATAFPTSELIAAAVDSESDHVLVLVDSCHAGELLTELGVLFADLSVDRYKHRGIAVITAGDRNDKPVIGSFTRLISLAHERLQDEASGYTASHLSFREWQKILDEVDSEESGGEEELIHWLGPHRAGRGLSACLPNPRYRRQESLTAPALRQLTFGEDSLEEFWLERASGRTSADDAGWYFSGRAEPMARIVSFVREGSGVLVVTGAAGSGKSALLSRLVTLADAGFATAPKYASVVAGIPDALRPAPGSVDIAVLARNKSALVVVEELLTALGGTPDNLEPSLGALLDRLAGRAAASAGRPVTVVIDALDEAEDPLACIGDIVLPLARLTAPDGTARAVRLMLGLRSSPETVNRTGSDLRDKRADQLLQRLETALEAEGVDEQVLRTDDPDCTADIAAYTTALLSAPQSSPYYGSEAAAAASAAAQRIAEAVSPSFLDARIAAEQLRTAPERQNLNEDDWLGRLKDGTTGLLREDIHAVANDRGVSAALLVAALRATAFAPGAGLPWAEVWPAVAAALATEAHRTGRADPAAADHAIRTLRLSRLGGYLAIAEEDARIAYRPVHQRLNDLLLTGHSWLLAPVGSTAGHSAESQSPAAAQAAITRALQRLVKQAGSHLAHPYVRRHFLHHAAAGGMLTDQEVPPELLAQETSGTLRARLTLPLPTDPARQTLTAAALIEPYTELEDEYASRLGSIAFHRTARGLGDPAGVPADLSGALPLTPSWGKWTARTNVLAATSGTTNAMCVVPALDDRQLIAVAAAEGGVQVWDAGTGRKTSSLGTGPVHRLRTIRATDGRTFLVTLGQRDVRIYDPVSGQVMGHTSLTRPLRDVHVLAESPEPWKLWILGEDGASVWKPRTGESSRVPDFPSIPSRDRQARAGAARQLTAVVRGRNGEVLIAIGSRGGIRFVDPESGQPSGSVDDVKIDVSGLVAVATPDDYDDLLIAEAHNHLQPLTVWAPFTQRMVASFRGGGRTVVASPDGTAIAYISGDGIVLRSLLRAGSPPLKFGKQRVEAFAILRDPAGPRVVSADRHGIRVWNPCSDKLLHENVLTENPGPSLGPEQHATTWPVCRSPLPNTGALEHTALVVATRNGLTVHDAATGTQLREISIRLIKQVLPLPAPGARVAVSEPGGRLSVWDLESGQNVMTSPEHPSPSIQPPCVTQTADGLPMAVSAASTGHQTTLTTVVLNHREHRTTTSTVQLSPGTDESAVHLLGALPAPPSGTVTAVASTGTELVLFDAASGDLKATLPGWGHEPGRSTMLECLTSEDERLLALSNGTDIGIWDLASAVQVGSWKSPGTFVLTSLPVSNGHTLLVTGGARGVRIWEPRTGRLVHTLLTGAPVHGISTGQQGSDTVLHIYGPTGLAMLTVNTSLLAQI